MTKIKVLFFDEAVAIGGSVVVLARLFQHIDRDRFIPKLVTGLDRESIEQLFDSHDVVSQFRPPLGYVAKVRWMNLCPYRAGPARSLWAHLFTAVAAIVNLPAHIGLLFTIARNRPDVLHANNGHDALLVSRLLGIPLVWHLHSSFGGSNRYVRRLENQVTKFVSVSNFVSSTAVRRGVSPDRIAEVPNPAPVYVPDSAARTEYRARFDVPGDAVLFAHVGRLVPWKGQMEFLQAFIRTTQAHPDVMALVVGDDLEGFKTPYARGLRRLAEDAGISGRVVFVGHVTDTLDLMSSVDVVVHSSIDPEPFGLVVTEAMIAGAAVVAARSGGPKEIIEHGVNGLLVDPTNTEEFADALSLLIVDESRRLALAKAGREMVRERYSPEVYARRLEAVYEGVVNRP